MLVSPSTVTLLKVGSTAFRRARSSVSGEAFTSVVTKARVVAMSGAIIPAPFAMPPIVTSPPARPTFSTLIFGRVSVVRIPSAAETPPPGPSSFAAWSMPANTVGIGRGTPITPVEATRTWPGSMSSAAPARSAIARASARPGSPVQAFALPLFATIARARPPARTSRQ